MDKPVEVTTPMTITLGPQQLNIVMRALEQMPYGSVRELVDDIHRQIVAQIPGGGIGHGSNSLATN